MNKPLQINPGEIRPGSLELCLGPMHSKKGEWIKTRLGNLDSEVMVYLPRMDMTELEQRSHLMFKEYKRPIRFIHEEKPEEIPRDVETDSEIEVVLIDNAHFYARLVPIVKRLLEKKKNVICSGLDRDFRGEPYLEVMRLLELTKNVTWRKGVCQMTGCDEQSTRTQRLIDNMPAKYDSPLVIHDRKLDERTRYESRCANHHYVIH